MAADYWRSSQANHWLVSPVDLQISRLEDIRYAGSEDKVGAVTIAMANAIAALAKRLGVRQRVTATATIFFHRFYAVPPNAYCNTDPCLVATACLYVAAKVEETPLHLRSVIHEAGKVWTEMGYPDLPPHSNNLAEMEFYLLQDLDYHLILHHPYRPLMAIVGAAGRAALQKSEANQGGQNGALSGYESAAEALGVGSSKMGSINLDMAGVGQSAASGNAEADAAMNKQTELALQLVEEFYKKAMTAGEDGQPIARAEEINEEVVYMAWSILNDTYRHPDLHMIYPPYILAVSALFLALVLVDSSRERMTASLRTMQQRRKIHERQIAKQQQELEEEQRRAKRERLAEDELATENGEAEQISVASPSNGSSRPTNAPTRTNSLGRPAQQPLSSRSGNPAIRPGLSSGAPPAASSPRSSGAAASRSGGQSPPVTPSNGPTKSIPHGGPTPPPDVLTFLAALDIAPISSLGSCIQAMLDGYALWQRVTFDIHPPDGSKKIIKWLEEWRKAREEELTVLQMGENERVAGSDGYA